MTDFAAIDFETANHVAGSVCAVGVVIVRGGQVAGSFYSLIKPAPDFYSRFCQRVHHLGPADTDAAPVFPQVWAKVEPMIQGLTLVAHNKSFDERQLRAAFRTYGMDYPDYPFLCTMQAARRLWRRELPDFQLQTVAARCGYDLRQHHNALADAEACAAIALKVL